jgi:hypothetical protein
MGFPLLLQVSTDPGSTHMMCFSRHTECKSYEVMKVFTQTSKEGLGGLAICMTKSESLQAACQNASWEAEGTVDTQRSQRCQKHRLSDE